MKSKLTYTGIRVRDLGKSVSFYTKLLGMKETGRTEIASTGGQSVQLVTEEGGLPLELNHYPEGSRFATKYAAGDGLDHLAFQVENLDEFLREAKRAGSPTVLDMRSGETRWAYIEDPNGIWIEVFA